MSLTSTPNLKPHLKQVSRVNDDRVRLGDITEMQVNVVTDPRAKLIHLEPPMEQQTRGVRGHRTS